MQHIVYQGSTTAGTSDLLRPYWVDTGVAEISPWEETTRTYVAADEIVRMFSRMDWLERRVETLMKRLDELGLTDVSDLI